MHHIRVGPNKTWHKETCPRRILNDDEEELELVRRNIWGYWSTLSRYRCPECEAEIEMDD